MLYLGHFSFDEIDAGGKPKQGYLSCIVDADSADDATAKFEPQSTNYTLPGVIGEDVTAYGFKPDVDIHDRPTDGGFIQAEPFITFEP